VVAQVDGSPTDQRHRHLTTLLTTLSARLTPTVDGTGLCTPTACARGETVLSLPGAAVLWATAPLGAPPPGHPAPWAVNVLSTPLGCLIRALAVAQQRGKASPYVNYVRALPQDTGTLLALAATNSPHFVPLARLLATHHPRLARRLAQQVNTALLSYVAMVEVASVEPARLGLFPPLWSVSRFLSTVAVVASRQNVVAGRGCLIPVWDMVNHEDCGRGGSTAWEEGRVVLRAQRDFAADEEVTMFYGDRSAADFFLYQGFVPDPMTRNWVEEDARVASADPWRVQALEKEGLPTDELTFRLVQDTRPDHELIRWFALATAASVDAATDEAGVAALLDRIDAIATARRALAAAVAAADATLPLLDHLARLAAADLAVTSSVAALLRSPTA